MAPQRPKRTTDALATYRKKRDFATTSEPEGDIESHRKGHLRFVIQKHAATQLHFDLRLELNGVMKSWAVPKGPSLDPSMKRLAMQVEDHPVSYNAFEGTIPAGEYGGGSVMIWDRGTYTADEAHGEDEEQVLTKEYADGKLAITFYGERMKGSFAIVRTRYSETKPQWLLIKHRDVYADADTDLVRDYVTSVTTGRTMDEIAHDAPPLVD